MITAANEEQEKPLLPLGLASRGFRGVVQRIDTEVGTFSLPPHEMEQRLLELGFLEGSKVAILHEGLIGRDPIAVRLNGTTVALRRKEAMAILVS